MTIGSQFLPIGASTRCFQQKIAEKAESVGVQKTKLDVVSLTALAVLAGAFIALGAMFATTVMAGADGVLPFGLSRLLAGIAFCLGLILVIVGGAEVFTGNALMVMAWAAGKVQVREMLRAWLIVYIGNFIGATGTAMLVFLSGQYLSGRGAVASVALKLGLDKATLPFDHAILHAILCNVLVCLAVWLALGARTTRDKVLAVLFPVSAFVTVGFEHSFANMYLIPIGLFVKAWGAAELWTQIGINLADYGALTWPIFSLVLSPSPLAISLAGAGSSAVSLVHLPAATPIGRLMATTTIAM
jgi:formate transporter